jgi:ketosteroid isomerase-like protein
MKRIPGQNPEQVLGVLEVCLRSVSKDIVREGRRITLFGLGPSPRGINRRDTTVIDVNAEDGVTTIDADVSFQASAFLGNTPQDSVVQAKLDRVFEDLRSQLGVDRWLTPTQEETALSTESVAPVYSETLPDAPFREEAVLSSATAEAFEDTLSSELEPSGTSSQTEDGSVETIPEEVPEAKTPEIQPEPEPVESPVAEVPRTPEPRAEELKENAPSAAIATLEPILAELVPEPQAAAESSKKIQPEVVTAQLPAVKEALPSEETQPKPAPQTVAVQPKPAEPRPASTAMPKPTAIAIARPGVVMSKPTRQEPLRATEILAPRSSNTLLDDSGSEEDEKKYRRLKWSAWVAAILVLVVAPAAWLYLPRQLEEKVATAQVRQPPMALPQAPPAQLAVETPAAKEPASDEDPAAVVKDWELALRSRDAAAQAAFYADPVARYFLRHDVSRDQVLADKQSSIDKRKGDWMVKMERVKLTRKGDTSAKVSLVKHYSVQENGRTVSEWFIPSQLQLVRADGKWQITSERDLGWAPSMDDLDY